MAHRTETNIEAAVATHGQTLIHALSLLSLTHQQDWSFFVGLRNAGAFCNIVGLGITLDHPTAAKQCSEILSCIGTTLLELHLFLNLRKSEYAFSALDGTDMLSASYHM